MNRVAMAKSDAWNNTVAFPGCLSSCESAFNIIKKIEVLDLPCRRQASDASMQAMGRSTQSECIWSSTPAMIWMIKTLQTCRYVRLSLHNYQPLDFSNFPRKKYLRFKRKQSGFKCRTINESSNKN